MLYLQQWTESDHRTLPDRTIWRTYDIWCADGRHHRFQSQARESTPTASGLSTSPQHQPVSQLNHFSTTFLCLCVILEWRI